MSMSVVRGPCTGAAKPKISLKIRVAVDGKTVGDWGKLYDESVKLQIIIDWSIEKAADKSERTLTFQRVEACTSEEALDRCGTILDAEYLPELAVADLVRMFGRFLKVHTSAGASSSGPTELPSAFDEIVASQQRNQGQLVLPTAPTGERFDFRLQRALISQLKQQG